jgi:signal transduction histidine kinase
MNDKWPGSITVSVCDSGPGIGEADQAKIFEEFQQADSLVTRENGTKTETIARARELIAAVLDPPPSINALQEVHSP